MRIFSRYYESARGEGATRIDRCYHFGDLQIVEAKYLPAAFSDHFGLIIKTSVPEALSRVISPKYRPSFRLTPEVIKDPLFNQRLEELMASYSRVREFQSSKGVGVLQWWELLVKPGILRLGLSRSKEINKEKRETLTLLL